MAGQQIDAVRRAVFTQIRLTQQRRGAPKLAGKAGHPCHSQELHHGRPPLSSVNLLTENYLSH